MMSITQQREVAAAMLLHAHELRRVKDDPNFLEYLEYTGRVNKVEFGIGSADPEYTTNDKPTGYIVTLHTPPGLWVHDEAFTFVEDETGVPHSYPIACSKASWEDINTFLRAFLDLCAEFVKGERNAIVHDNMTFDDANGDLRIIDEELFTTILDSFNEGVAY